jgi:hypothetical protein
MKDSGVIQIEHHYTYPPAAVWKALTDPALHARWWAAGDVRPVVGHKFELDMGGWGKQPCEVPPGRAGKTPAVPLRRGLSRYHHHLGVESKLTHEGFNLDSPLGRQAFEGMQPGWPGVLLRLGALLTPIPTEANRLPPSENPPQRSGSDRISPLEQNAVLVESHSYRSEPPRRSNRI